MAIISLLSHKDLTLFKALIVLFNKVFENPDSIAGDEQLSHLLKSNTFKVFAAQEGDLIVGGITAYILPQYYSNTPSIYIYDVAVDSHYQRRQIGSQLLDAVKVYAEEKGYGDVYVQAEANDPEALSFYEANGGLKVATAQFTFR
ncbi:GNAT family N-acetyltransferase [Mucilaginibacter sp. HD30]